MKYKGKKIQLDFEWKVNSSGPFVRFNCSECGGYIFGINEIKDENMMKWMIDIIDENAVLTCRECLQK